MTLIYYPKGDSFFKGANCKQSTQLGELILNSELIISLSLWVGERGDQNSEDSGGRHLNTKFGADR